MSDEIDSFGRRVAARRAVVGLTQAQLAERARIGRGALATIETGGQEIRARDVAPLLEALAVPDGEWPAYLRQVAQDAAREGA